METEKEVKEVKNIGEQGGVKEEDMRMEDLLGEHVVLEEGKIMKARVISEVADGVFVDLGLKSEALIPKSEFEPGGIPKELSPGSEINVKVIRLRTENGHPHVSFKQAKELTVWDTIINSFKQQQPVDGTVKRKIKGGFMVDIGVDAFLPASQLDIRQAHNPDSYIGQSYKFLVTEVNRAQRNVVITRRKLLETEKNELKGKTLAALSEGQVLEGSVTGITDFGAFIDIGGVEGLLHIKDLSWQHVKNVKEVLKFGQKVSVKVLRIDKEKGKISLGLKQLSVHPWENVEERYPIGVVVKGKVKSVADFGAFIEIEPGLEGLLHVSEVSWSEKGDEGLKKFTAGQELELKVIAVDRSREKLSLSLKRLQSDPWEEAQRHYSPGARIKGNVSHLTPFGAFVKLPEGIEGLIHVADMSWMRKVQHPQDIVNVGQEVESIVMEVSPKNEKIVLSIKHLTEDPFKKYKAGTVVHGIVKRIVEFGAFVELEPGVEALLRMSEIAPRKVENPQELIKAEDKIEAKVIKSDSRERKIDISIKKLELERERELLKKYVNKSQNPKLGDILEEDQQ